MHKHTNNDRKQHKQNKAQEPVPPHFGGKKQKNLYAVLLLLSNVEASSFVIFFLECGTNVANEPHELKKNVSLNLCKIGVCKSLFHRKTFCW